MRVLIAVLIVLALSYAILAGWHYAVARGRAYANDVIAQWEKEPMASVKHLTETYDLGDAQKLVVRNDFGSAQVTAGGSKVQVEAEVFAPGMSEDALARARRATLASSRRPDGAYEISVQAERGRPAIRVDLAVQAPPGAALEVRLASGNGRVEGIGAPVTVSTGSGDISIDDVAGPVVAETGSGSAQVARVRSSVVVSSGSGNVEVADVGGDVKATSHSGSVRLRDARGREVVAKTHSGDVRMDATSPEAVTAETFSGNVEVAVAEPFAGDMTAKSSSGSVRVTVPRESACQIHASTRSGTVSTNLPVTASKLSHTELYGALGAGRGSIEAETLSGSVTINAPD
jgi:hypothetical protein